MTTLDEWIIHSTGNTLGDSFVLSNPYETERTVNVNDVMLTQAQYDTSQRKTKV